MKTILSKSAVLSDALQRKDQDILNAMDLVSFAKHDFAEMRSDIGWNALLGDVEDFCKANDIDMPDMDSTYVTLGRPRRNAESITFGHHYQVDVFFDIIDTQLTELNDRFPEESSLLLKRLAYLNPDHLLTQGNVGELVALARMYPMDFSAYDLILLEQQLRNFRLDLKSNESLREVRSLSGLAVRLIELNKSVTYHLVFRLITLALTLPVSTASTERTFSALKKNVKTRLRNKIGDGFLADALVLYVEKDMAKSVSNEAIIERFAAMGDRRLQLK